MIGGGIVACSFADTGSGARSASDHAAAIARRPRKRATRPRLPAGPVIEVTGAPQGVKAKGAVLADAATGQVLWGRGLNAERPMASVTKVMTALMVIDSGHLDQEIRVPQAAFNYAWKYGGGDRVPAPGR